jgi:hypothetical protein
VQTSIENGPWATKSKIVKTAIGKAWTIFHTKAILGVKLDNPYFVEACKETQR